MISKIHDGLFNNYKKDQYDLDIMVHDIYRDSYTICGLLHFHLSVYDNKTIYIHTLKNIIHNINPKMQCHYCFLKDMIIEELFLYLK